MSAFRHSLHSLPRSFWVLVGATFVNRFGVFVIPFLTIFMTRKGFSAADASWAIAAYSVGAFFAAGVGGWLADRMGRNVTMALSSLGGAACMMVFSQAESLEALVIISALTGFVSEAGNPAANALVQDLVPAEHRVAAYAVLRFAVNLGWAIGPACAGFLMEKSFFWLFAGDAATSAIFGVVAWRFLPRGRGVEKSRSGWSHALVSIRRNKEFLALFAASVAMSMVFRQTSTTYTLHFERSGLAMHWCGLVLALNGVMICLLEIPLTAFTRRLPVRTAIALGYAGMGLSHLVLLGSHSLAAFTLLMVLFTAGEMLAFSRQQAYAAGLSPEEMRGRYSGFLSFAWSIGNITGVMVGLRAYALEPALVWWGCGVLGVVAAGLLLRRKPEASLGRNATGPGRPT